MSNQLTEWLANNPLIFGISSNLIIGIVVFLIVAKIFGKTLVQTIQWVIFAIIGRYILELFFGGSLNALYEWLIHLVE